MKTYYICAATFFILAYAIFHFGFRTGGETQLYRINDELAFELLLTPNSYSFDDVTIRGYRRTNPLIRFMCGACEANYGEIDMLSADYIKGDWVYAAYPQHSTWRTDIMNLRTGETLSVDVPGNAENPIDLQTLPEYRERGLVAGEQHRLTQDYVKANFELLTTYSSRCIWIHIIFGVLALILTFPKISGEVLAGVFSNKPGDPINHFNSN